MEDTEDKGSEHRVHIDRDRLESDYRGSGRSPLTPSEDQVGSMALKAYVDRMLEVNGLGWEEAFIPDSVFVQGAVDIVEAADAAEDQSQQGRLTAGSEALRAALVEIGQSDKVSDTALIEATGEVLTAVAKVRAQENPPPQAVQAAKTAAETAGDEPQGEDPNAGVDLNADPPPGMPADAQTGVVGPSESADA